MSAHLGAEIVHLGCELLSAFNCNTLCTTPLLRSAISEYSEVLGRNGDVWVEHPRISSQRYGLHCYWLAS